MNRLDSHQYDKNTIAIEVCEYPLTGHGRAGSVSKKGGDAAAQAPFGTTAVYRNRGNGDISTHYNIVSCFSRENI
jgi:hypothetical protein